MKTEELKTKLIESIREEEIEKEIRSIRKLIFPDINKQLKEIVLTKKFQERLKKQLIRDIEIYFNDNGIMDLYTNKEWSVMCKKAASGLFK